MANKGIKRHKSLYPLSHHHHHALFLALNLRRAGTEESRYSVEEIERDLISFWKERGNQHFREEEEILLPIYAEYESVDQPEIKEMLAEHVKIRSIIYQIEKAGNDPVLLMQELGHLLEAHIRKEERVLFPMMEEALTEEALQELASLLHTDGK